MTGLAGPVLAGCAGWAITRTAAAQFPAAGSVLERYAAVLNAVEINSSFYRPHQAKTYARWAASVPAAFRFSVKLPRTISHELRLRDIELPLARFAGEANALGEKLGCVLLQLPPSLAFETGLADDFLQRVRASFGCMLACEARHPSWFSDSATRLLQQHGVTRVLADPPTGQPGPHVPTTAASYRRLHGAPRIYYSSYDDVYLARLSAELRQAATGGMSWLIFDNTAAGAALENLLQLKRTSGL